ncbi:hypothetical protein JIG36_09845 [Actinoplanes sp. LDG1-06]|uniref:AAA+ ATPase domain-containing protein n=1 Tax=Paractinoplanes ovalisporus TaxID=2810368 RepID=A0ABS2A7T1_9ACTN|nr:hypothetical protein [Actinoplanes ovalisporus]MBM2615857.1 hypothetical protein [Actinoplanes ovalisporus]
MTSDASGWDELERVGADSDPSAILEAARTDLKALADRVEERLSADPALRLLVSIDYGGPIGPHLLVRVGDRPEPVMITDRVLVRALERGVRPLELLAYAIAAPLPLDPGWRPRRIGHATPPNEEQARNHQRIFRNTGAYEQVDRALTRGRDVLVVGPHGSGRSALIGTIARRLGNLPYQQRRGIIWLNLTDPADGPESIVMALLEAERHEGYVVVVEGLQANLPVLDALFQFITRLRAEFGLRVQVLASGWRSVADLLGRDGSFALTQIRVDARATIDVMLRESIPSAVERAKIRPLLVDDVHLAARAIDIYKRTGKVPTEVQLGVEFTKPDASGEERHALYFLACLGYFGLALPEKEAARFGDGVVERLHKDDLVHRTDGAYAIAPRRRAKIVLRHALNNWSGDLRDEDAPESIVWQHLQEGGERLIRATLSQIELVVSPEELRPESLSLLAAWERSEQLGDWLERRTRDDPRWGNNLGSAVFAAIALTRLNRESQWLSIAEPIRGHWRYDDPEKRVLDYVGEHTTDFADFDEIAVRMRIEDELSGRAGHPTGIPWDKFDREHAYRNWALGLLLCLEGTAPSESRDEQRIEQLLKLAERAAEPDGSFYPARVPWVTARIVIGLLHAELSPQDNPTIMKACKWLLSLVTKKERPAEGEPPETSSWWRGGTGSWNRDEATTAMCLTALILAGFGEREQVATALTWLRGREPQWCKTDHEIDLAQVVETLAAADEPFDSYLRELLDRTLQELDSEPAERPEEQLRTAFLAAQLSEIVRQTVHNEFLRLLRDVMKPGVATPETPAAEPVVESPSTGPVAEPVAEGPCGLLPAQLESWQEACLMLSQKLTEQISGRQSVDAPTVQRGLKEKLAQRDRYFRLRERLTARAPATVLVELNQLGLLVCGQTWPPLPFPDRYCDDDAP